MKTKKLEKKTVFLFKRTNLSNLTKEQMRKINGGDSTNNDNDTPISTGANICNETINQTY
ncbi:hypothetical protein GJU39_15020 [Pedobacter petrophilus]|uniref:Bacteriocin n=1 Tax=Pedobacter petrophilus TaxID=1908241 RepID=A0A7K0G0L8_9SPHI|nr:hypothetical protein [Pedobacter petrophilus]MRX77397.1 hypothetical protein [Pedobacter petrophilus]